MKHIVNITCIMLTVVFVWAIVSWGEIVLKNTTSNPQYSDFNLIVMVLD